MNYTAQMSLSEVEDVYWSHFFQSQKPGTLAQ